MVSCLLIEDDFVESRRLLVNEIPARGMSSQQPRTDRLLDKIQLGAC